MPRSQHKSSTSHFGNSHSYIFSDISRAIHREQALSRKLKHLQDQNMQLQDQIRHQEEQIKDQRTIIIYQMNQLVRSVMAKVAVTGEVKVDRKMLADDGIKKLINKFQDIEKEQSMVAKVRGGLDKMYAYYDEHKKSIDDIMNEGNQQYLQLQTKMRSVISQKKNQLAETQEQISGLCQQIRGMQEEIAKFEADEPLLDEEEESLKEQIINREKEIEQLGKKLVDISKWEEIVVDRKVRMELIGEITKKREKLRTVQEEMSKIGVRVNEVKMKVHP